MRGHPQLPPLSWRQGGRGCYPSAFSTTCARTKRRHANFLSAFNLPLTPGSLGTGWASRGLQPPTLTPSQLPSPSGTGSRPPHTCSHRHQLLPDRMIQGSPGTRGCREAPISLRFMSRAPPPRPGSGPCTPDSHWVLSHSVPSTTRKVSISSRNLTMHCLNEINEVP